MGIFDTLFTTQQAKVANTLKESLNKGEISLMCTSKSNPKEIYSFGPVYDKKMKKSIVFATDDEKTAILYALRPMYYFTFGQNDKSALVMGNNHSLLKLDSIVAYIYYVDSSSFEPIVSEHGDFNNEWISTTDVHIRTDKPIRKVTFKDVLKSGIQVFWVKDKSIANEFNNQIVSSGFTNGNQKLDFLKDQANWYPDKVVYMNAYEKIGLATQTEAGWDVPKQQINLEEVSANDFNNVNINTKNSSPISPKESPKLPQANPYQRSESNPMSKPGMNVNFQSKMPMPNPNIQQMPNYNTMNPQYPQYNLPYEKQKVRRTT